MNLIQILTEKKLITPPSWLPENVHYLVMTGSIAYAVSDDTSDVDVYGFCFPKKEMVFPHLAGHIQGFGKQVKRFEQYQQHHIEDFELRKHYDLTIYSIVKFFQLCMENNPNMVDALFVPQNCVLHMTQIGNLVREKRTIFLHKGCWHKFKGYAYSQLNKMSRKEAEGKRQALIDEFGYDVKFAYHVVRLLDEVEQILTTGDLDLTRANEVLKAIRRGEWSEEKVRQFFEDKERQLEEVYEKSDLPWGPNEDRIKALLIDCLEYHYGDLDKAVVKPDRFRDLIDQIKRLLEDV